MRIPDPKANTTTEAYLAYKAGYLEENELKPVLYEPYLHFDGWLAYWAGLTNEYPLDKNGDPEMLTDEEALVAYLSGVTNTYPEEIKDPYDVRIVGYLKYLVSARWGRPEYPVNNEEFYLSTMKPPVVTNDTPSADMELDDTAEAPFIDVKAYGDTSQTTYTGKNKINSSISNMTIKDASVTESDGVYNFVATSTNLPRVTIPMGSLVEGDTYTLSCKVRANKVNPSFTYVRLRATTTGGSWIASEPTQQYFSVSSDFVDVKLVFTAPSSSPAVWFYLSSSDVGEFEVDLDVKDIQVEAGEEVTAFEPYVGGVPAPSPDYPQDVNVVTGRQVVGVSGKNMARLETSANKIVGGLDFTTDNGYINIDGKSTETSEFYFDNFRVPSSGDAVFSLEVNGYTDKSGSNSVLILQSSTTGTGSWNSIATVWLTSYEQKAFNVEIDNNLYYRIRLLVRDECVFTNATLKPQLELGSTATSFVPYKAPVDYEINFGKNLFDKSNPNVIVGTVEAGGYNASGSNKSFYLKCESNTTYTIQKRNDGDTNRFIIATANTIPVQGTAMSGLTQKNNDSSVTITTGNDAKYIVCTFYRNTEATLTEQQLIDSIQVEVGSTATSYAPYFEPIELCKIGDYQDYIYRDEDGDWYVHKAIGKITYTGNSSENWQYSDTSSGPFRIAIPNSKYHSSNNVAPLVYCDYYTPIKWTEISSTAYAVTAFNNNVLPFRNRDIADLDAWKTWLGSHNMTVYYPFATSTDTQITNSELISQLDALMEGGSYEDKTYIKVTATDPNLPGLLYVEAGKYD